jgi:hypothetical protein
LTPNQIVSTAAHLFRRTTSTAFATAYWAAIAMISAIDEIPEIVPPEVKR